MSETLVKPKRTVIKQEEFAELYSDGTILVKCIRASYPHVFKPYKSDNDPADKKGSYSVVGLMPKLPQFFPSVRILIDKQKEVAVQAKNLNIPKDRFYTRDGNLRPDKPAYPGNYTISAAEVNKPIVLGAFKDPKTGKPVRLVEGIDDRLVFGGCWCSILIRPWYQSNSFGKRVNAGLLAFQLLPIDHVRKFIPDAKADPFGEGRITEDDVDESFGTIADGDSGYDDNLGLDADLDNLGL